MQNTQSDIQQEATNAFRIEDLPRPHTPELDALIASGKIIKDQLAYRLDLTTASAPEDSKEQSSD